MNHRDRYCSKKPNFWAENCNTLAFFQFSHKEPTPSKPCCKTILQWGFQKDKSVISSHIPPSQSCMAQIAQDAGDGIALAGYAATLTGVGAEVGAPVAAVGNTISNVGAFAEIGLDLINGDAGDSFKGFAYYIAEKGIEYGINKVMPGSTGPETKDVVKYVKNKVTGEATGKSILGKDFNLGKSIVSQSAGLKAILVEKAIDTAINKDKE